MIFEYSNASPPSVVLFVLCGIAIIGFLALIFYVVPREQSIIIRTFVLAPSIIVIILSIIYMGNYLELKDEKVVSVDELEGKPHITFVNEKDEYIKIKDDKSGKSYTITNVTKANDDDIGNILKIKGTKFDRVKIRYNESVHTFNGKDLSYKIHRDK